MKNQIIRTFNKVTKLKILIFRASKQQKTRKVLNTLKVKVLPSIRYDEVKNEDSDEGMKSSVFHVFLNFYYQLDNNKRGNILF